MIIIQTGDITKIKTEAIVNAANGIGIMGKGVAGSIRKSGGYKIQKEAREICKKNGNINEGSFYVTGPGNLLKNGVKKIYHAVTMKYPGGLTSLNTVSNVLKNIIKDAIKNKLKSIAIPGLGTGIGRLDKSVVAAKMAQIIENYHTLIDISIVDSNEYFIEMVKKSLKTEWEKNDMPK